MKKKKKNYAFIGVRGSGKSHRCQKLHKEENYYILGFAIKLKEVVEFFLGLDKGDLTDEKVYDDFKRNKFVYIRDFTEHTWLNLIITGIVIFLGNAYTSFTGREVLIGVGDGLRNFVDQNIWINFVRDRIYRILDRGGNFAVQDCRYINEALMLISFGTVLIFTNYKSKRYQIGKGDSEWLPNKLLSMGYQDGDVIAPNVIRKLAVEFEKERENKK